MSRKKKLRGIRTTVAANTRICGDIEFSGDALICGSVEGNLRALTEGATLIIGPEGRAAGSIIVPRLIVHGRVEGRVWVTEFLNLSPTAVVKADFRYERSSHGADATLVSGGEGMVIDGKTETESRIARKGPRAVHGSEDHATSSTELNTDVQRG